MGWMDDDPPPLEATPLNLPPVGLVDPQGSQAPAPGKDLRTLQLLLKLVIPGMAAAMAF